MIMKTEILSSDHPQSIPCALEILKQGGLVAFPTDTVYGVGGSVFNPRTVEQIYRVKERPYDNPLPVLIGELRDLNLVALPLTDQIRSLIGRFWPGPLTLVIPALPGIPPLLSPQGSVGVRQPDHLYARQLLSRTGPLAATSANLSGGHDPCTAREVVDQLGGRIDLILDGGTCSGGRPSTVVDCTGKELSILRQGDITLEMLTHRD
jgi:L-threonylcarbamoyladenylate synthase